MSTLKVDTIQNAVGENLVFNNRNLIINGGMNIWQRATSVTGKTSGGYFTADRWQTSITTAGTWSQSRSTDVPSAQGFGYSLKMDCTTADASLGASDVLAILQRFEGQNLQHLLKGSSSAKKLTLSFWVKSNKTGTYIAEIVDNDNSRQISKSYTISSANTWEKKTITFEGDTLGALDNDNDHSLRVLFWLAAGSSFTSGTLNTSWASTVQANRVVGQVNLADSTSNEFYLTGCQLETGSVASDFEFEPYETTLRKCQRYFISYGGTTAYERFAFGFYYTSTLVYCGAQFPTTMRTVPDGGTSGNLTMLAVPNETVSSISYTQLTVNSMILTVTTTTNTAANGAVLAASNDINARITMDAEL